MWYNLSITQNTYFIVHLLPDTIRNFLCVVGHECAGDGLLEFGCQFFFALTEECSLFVSINTSLKKRYKKQISSAYKDAEKFRQLFLNLLFISKTIIFV